MLDAYTAIEDYHYGDQPPYGCQHIFVGEEEVGNVSKYYAARSTEEALKAIENAREKCGLLHTEMSQQQIIEYNNFIKSELSQKSFIGTQFAPKCNVVAKELNNFSGEYDHKTKTILINKTYKKDLLGAIYKTKNNILINKDEAYAFVTYLHEKIHSETFVQVITNEYDRAIREGLTEYLARKQLLQIAKLEIKFGNYELTFNNINEMIKKINISEKEILGYLRSSNINRDLGTLFIKSKVNYDTFKKDLMKWYKEDLD